VAVVLLHLDQIHLDHGGGGSGVLQKITIPATSGQVINFTIGTGRTEGTPSVSP